MISKLFRRHSKLNYVGVDQRLFSAAIEKFKEKIRTNKTVDNPKSRFIMSYLSFYGEQLLFFLFRTKAKTINSQMT